MRDRILRTAATAAALGIALSAPAHGSVTSVALSPDHTVELDGVVFDDEAVAVDDLLGVTIPTSLGALPENAEVTAYHLLASGDQLFALSTTAALPGPLIVEPRDVVRYDGVGYALEFDGSTIGIPDGVTVDGVSRPPGGGNLLLSFDTGVDLGGGLVAADEDVVDWNGAVFALVFDGSAEGIEDGVDVDGVHDAGSGELGLSFDTSGSVGGIDFDDEDVLLFDPSGPTWTLAYDGSALHAALGAADVEAIALPETSRLLMLASGLAALLALKALRFGPRRLPLER
jgi:hypothetical protein